MKTELMKTEIAGAAKRFASSTSQCGITPMQIEIEENADMAQHTSFKAGGCAAALVTVRSVVALKAVLQIMAKLEVPHIFLGNGSNMLFRDEGYDGAVIKMADFGKLYLQPEESFTGEIFPGLSAEESRAEDTVMCEAGIYMSTLAKQLMNAGLSGFEFASGIPGSLGGGLFMNAGAYGGELKDIVKGVLAVSPDGSCTRVFTNEEMQFAYRHSILQENGYIAVAASLKLAKDEPAKIAERMRELAQKRNSKQPVQYPSAGSTFKRPEGYFAGKLIEDAGLKGVSVGGAQVSTLHSGFVINRGGATATDILQLMALIQNTVYDKFGVKLEPEVRIIGSQA